MSYTLVIGHRRLAEQETGTAVTGEESVLSRLTRATRLHQLVNGQDNGNTRVAYDTTCTESFFAFFDAANLASKGVV